METSEPSSSSVKRNDDEELADTDLAQAWKELQRGEKAAQALEAGLTNLERKLDDMLASFEASERLKVDQANNAGDGSSGGGGGVNSPPQGKTGEA